MNNKQIKRNSNIEFLRILSMVMIVAHHFALYSTWDLQPGIQINKFLIQFFLVLGKIGVNIFFMISGYFLINTVENQLKRIKVVWFQVFFYAVSINIIFLVFLKSVSKYTLLVSIFPISKGFYWFASVYVFILIFVPFINSFLNSMNKKTFIKFLSLYFLVFIFIPTFTRYEIAISKILIALFSYSVGAFFNKYKLSIKEIKYLKLSGLLSIIILFGSIIALDFLSIKFNILNGKEAIFFSSDQSFVMMILACCIFYFSITRKETNNNLTNTVASTTFGIYLIHEHVLVRDNLWNFLNINQYLNSPFFIIYCLLTILIVFSICSIIEFLRQYIFNIVKKAKRI